MMKEKNKGPVDLIILGTYTDKQVEILKKELEKNNIPIQVFYPKTSEARSEWLAHSVMIQPAKLARALEICKELGLPTDAKMPQNKADKVFNWVVVFLIIAGISIIIYIFRNKIF